MVNYHEKLAAKVPLIGKTWEEEWKPAVIAQNIPLKTADWSGAQRRRAGRQARRADRADARAVVDPRAHQLRAAVEQRVLRPLRQGDAARRADRGVPHLAGLPHPLGRRRPRPVGAQPDGARQPDAEGAVRQPARAPSCSPPSTRATRAATSAASSTSSCSSTAGARRRVRPRRRAVAGGSVDPAGQHQGDDRPRRERGPGGPVPARTSPPGSGCSPTCARSWPTIPRRWRSSTSCTKPRSTASRSPRTTPSTSTSCTSACSAASCSPSATASSPRACSTPPTTSSSSTATSWSTL